MNTILIKRKTSSGAPSVGDLNNGEFCLVEPDGNLYLKNLGALILVNSESSYSPSVFGAKLSATFQFGTGNSYVDITGWSEDVSDSDFSFNISTGELTVQSDGLYKVGYNITTDQYNGNNRDSSWAQLVLNGTLIDGTRQGMYNRLNLHGFCSGGVDVYVNLSSNDIIKMQGRNESTARQHQALVESTYLRASKIR